MREPAGYADGCVERKAVEGCAEWCAATWLGCGVLDGRTQSGNGGLLLGAEGRAALDGRCGDELQLGGWGVRCGGLEVAGRPKDVEHPSADAQEEARDFGVVGRWSQMEGRRAGSA